MRARNIETTPSNRPSYLDALEYVKRFAGMPAETDLSDFSCWPVIFQELKKMGIEDLLILKEKLTLQPA